jgi:ABC-2 type transport system permease protein
MIDARLVWLFIRLGVLHELAYGANLAAQVVSSTLGLIASLLFLGAVFANSPTVAGWRVPDLLAVLAAFYLLTGLLGTFVQPSLQIFIDDVLHGTLDFTLTRPRDAQLLVSIQQVNVWRLVDIGLGLGLLIVALVQLDGRVGPAQAAGFIVVLVTGAMTMYSCCLLLATLAFWFARMDNVLIVFLSFWEAGRWPVDVYPGWLRSVLTFLVPVALATTVPARVLSGQVHPIMLAAVLAAASGLLVVTRLVWLRGLRHYSGASA